jgi:hypothetical protein
LIANTVDILTDSKHQMSAQDFSKHPYAQQDPKYSKSLVNLQLMTEELGESFSQVCENLQL